MDDIPSPESIPSGPSDGSEDGRHVAHTNSSRRKRRLVLWASVALALAALALAAPALLIRSQPMLVSNRLLASRVGQSVSYAGTLTVEARAQGVAVSRPVPIQFDLKPPNLVRLEVGTLDKPSEHLLLVGDGTWINVLSRGGVLRFKSPSDFAQLDQWPPVQQAVATMTRETGLTLEQLSARFTKVKTSFAGLDPESRWMATLPTPALTTAVTTQFELGPKVTLWVQPLTRQPKQLAMELTAQQLLAVVSLDQHGPRHLTDRQPEFGDSVLRVVQTIDRYSEGGSVAPSRFVFTTPPNTSVVTVESLDELFGSVSGSSGASRQHPADSPPVGAPPPPPSMGDLGRDAPPPPSLGGLGRGAPPPPSGP